MSSRIVGLLDKGLDTILTHFGFEERDGYLHDAEEDAECAAKIFMKLKEMPPVNVVDGGFLNK